MEDDEIHSKESERVTVSRATLRLELLEMEVRLKEYLRGSLTELRQEFFRRASAIEADVRALQEVNRLRDAANAAVTAEAERRRAARGGNWAILNNKAAVGAFLIASAMLLIAVLTLIHHY